MFFVHNFTADPFYIFSHKIQLYQKEEVSGYIEYLLIFYLYFLFTYMFG